MSSFSSLRPYVDATRDFVGGTSTPRAFLDACIAAIQAREADIRAFCALDLAGARAQADASTLRWRSGRALSLIDGMPLGIKDVIETVDMPTGMGSPIFNGWMSGRDSASTFALRGAGCVIVGKTVTTEFAATEPGPTRNPHDLSRTPGGSSSGSAAAVGAGMLSAALGTQVIGSIVRPASYCGCYGFKPTVGAINRGGSHDYHSQSAQGVLAASLADAWQVLWEIAQRAGGDPGALPLQGPAQLPSARKPARIAVLETAGWPAAGDAAKAAVMRLLTKVSLAGVGADDRRSAPMIKALEDAVAEAMPMSQAINAWEGRWPLNTYNSQAPEKLSSAMRQRLSQGEKMSPNDYVALLQTRDVAREAYDKLRAEYDAIVTLAAPDVAPIGVETTGNPVFAVPGSYLGVPALSLPLCDIAGLPLNVQIMGFRQHDAALFAVAGFMETLIRA